MVGAIVFYGWVGVYIVSPPAVFALWWTNRRTDSGEPAPGEAIVPPGVRRMAQAFAAGALVAAAVFFLSPQTAIAMRLKADRRDLFVATALLLVGAIRAWGDFDTGNVMTYLYVGGLVAMDVALLLLYRSMSRAGATAGL